ncbi:tetratricopeptide repeat protein 7B [Condylostylus longicornis]|uniref:tetratricopeptide repeat protein 7B n=1 Tax=Condylostylus longicornis TaxID=2530218 RepID=UPI00244E3FAD|nr:tetratricopeptide repeat protein 7B [Condylostylus longicornis]
MTNRVRNTSKVEALIESCRSEGKWQKVIELAEELKISSPNCECLANFLLGEGYLENYLEENDPIETNFTKAKTGLQESRQCLSLVTGDDGRRAGIALDAYLLLAKLCYACGQYEESLENFIKAELNTLSEKELTLRSLKILAESYAIKGLCLEHQTSRASSKFKKAEKETEMITCFERATDLGLLYLQEQDMSQPVLVGSESSSTRRMGTILETALQRAPIVLIKTGKLQEAVERYRVMLNAIETRTTQSLRLTLARQLAEVLLRGVSGTIYTPPKNLSSSKSGSAKKLWKPTKYSGRNFFVPRNQHEETILLLLISESLAVRDAVLSQSPEFRVARIHALGNATAVYDLLTLATVRWNLINLLNDSFEKSLKFTFCEQHVWGQYALSLVSLNRHSHAIKALKESSKLAPNDPVLCLLSARLCYEHLGLIQKGLQHSEQALMKGVKGIHPTRTQLYIGIGLQQNAVNATLRSEKEKYSALALKALEKAVQNDPNDHLAAYYLALQHAFNYNIPEALVHIGNALNLRTEHAPSLHLFGLLLTASRRPREALSVIEDALQEFPDNLNLLHVKAHLQLYLYDPETSLMTVQKMLSLWRDLYEMQAVGTNNENDVAERQSDTRSLLQLQHSSQLSDKDSNSIYAASVAAVSRVEQALSEVASSLSSFNPRSGPQSAWMIQLKVWLLLADIYLTIDQPNEALNCILEASQIYPLSHQIMFMRGQVYVYLSQWTDAKQCFLNAVAANPCHTDALRYLGETHHILGEPRLAEKMLKDAAKLDPNCPKIWFSLGKVLETLGDYTASADCMATALQLEPSCPVLPFTSISLTFE